jgi:menaquinone-dependent protoporphyrinogen oxidase
MSKILIVYATKHGHTAKVATRIADRLRSTGAAVDASDIAEHPRPDISGYDGVIVGASIHGGHHQREITEWVRHDADRLSLMPSALFSVSLTAADETDEARAATRGYIDELIDDTGWRPVVATSFAGALQYLEYDFMTRLLMRLLMAHGHHDTDTSADHEYTDWAAVDRFADECRAMVSLPVTLG